MYRLTICPELSLGLFSTGAPDDVVSSSSTYPFARAPDSTNPAKRGVLIAHVIATKSTALSVTDSSMDIPPNWKKNLSSSETRGHQEHGRTLAIHSLATLPRFQNRGFGKTVMKSYIQRMETSGLADRIALLAHDHLVKYYEALGFRNRGKSEAKFGGGEWNDMVYEIINHAPES